MKLTVLEQSAGRTTAISSSSASDIRIAFVTPLESSVEEKSREPSVVTATIIPVENGFIACEGGKAVSQSTVLI